MERFVAAEISHAAGSESLSIVLVNVPQSGPGRARGSLSDRLVSLAAAITRMLRGADVLAQYSEGEFVVVLTQTDDSAAASVVSRIAAMASDLYADGAPNERPVLGFATAPTDGLTLDALVTAARGRQSSVRSPIRPPAIH